MIRIVLMEYLNMNIFFSMPDADMKLMLEAASESPPIATEIQRGGRTSVVAQYFEI